MPAKILSQKRRLYNKASPEMNATLLVKFGEHIPLDQVASMVSSIAAYGNVLPGPPDRDFSVEVFRASKLPKIKDQLVKWEQYGFLRWSTDPGISD